jgi:threonine dehydratase
MANPRVLRPTDIAAAADRIGPHIRMTPLEVSAPMSERAGSTVVIKAEHSQLTGSFKIRGALNKVLTLDPDTRGRGIVTASSGNHGIAVASAAQLAGCSATVYLPTGASSAKAAEIRRRGASIVMVASADAYQAEVEARAAAEVDGLAYLSPYNDVAVVAGQGTIGREITEQAERQDLDPIDAVVAAVGGGGLIAGIGTWLAERAPSVTLIGASPANDAAMMASVRAGQIVEPPTRPTFSDGTAGGIEPGAITFELCRDLVDEWVTVPEEAIAKAVAAMIDDHHQLVEGAAGVALAAAANYAEQHPGSTVVAVSCGANITSSTLARILHHG